MSIFDGGEPDFSNGVPIYDAGGTNFPEISSNALSAEELGLFGSVGPGGTNAKTSNKGDGAYNNTQPVLRIPPISFAQLANPMQATGNSNVLLWALIAVVVVVVLVAAKK